MLSEIEATAFPHAAHVPLRDPAKVRGFARYTVRTIPQTNLVLQRMVERERLTFWSEAIRLLFDYLGHHRDVADLENLLNAPRSISMVDFRVDTTLLAGGEMESRGVNVEFTGPGRALVEETADEYGIPFTRMAALILHRNAATAFAAIYADGRGVE